MLLCNFLFRLYLFLLHFSPFCVSFGFCKVPENIQLNYYCISIKQSVKLIQQVWLNTVVKEKSSG